MDIWLLFTQCPICLKLFSNETKSVGCFKNILALSTDVKVSIHEIQNISRLNVAVNIWIVSHSRWKCVNFYQLSLIVINLLPTINHVTGHVIK